MSYIRTMEGIYNKEKCCIEGQVVKFSNKWFSIVDEADTIDKLCDEFVLMATIDGKSEYQYSDKLILLKFSEIAYKHDRRFLTEIYGAILVEGEHNEPILKSIAKMNEKGEFELL